MIKVIVFFLIALTQRVKGCKFVPDEIAIVLVTHHVYYFRSLSRNCG